MVFITFCDNKGCRQEMEPVVDKETLKAYCTVCGEEINCIAEPMRRHLVASGQVRKLDKKRLGFAQKCPYCEKTEVPVIKVIDEQGGREILTCAHCGKHLDKIPAPFAEMLKMQIKSFNRGD
jgi:rRNA maturation protein Nop10